MRSERATEIYTLDFYSENHANKHQYVALGNAIHAVLGPGSVVDVGSGPGLIVERLVELGHDAWGLDGSEHAKATTPESVRDRIRVADLTDPEFHVYGDANAAVCIEVAEHLPTEAADRLVNIVRSFARSRIVWSAAPPGQGGVDHVNEQPPEYWLSRFVARGWIVDEVLTDALRVLMWAWKAQHCYAAANFHVLVRK